MASSMDNSCRSLQQPRMFLPNWEEQKAPGLFMWEFSSNEIVITVMVIVILKDKITRRGKRLIIMIKSPCRMHTEDSYLHTQGT